MYINEIINWYRVIVFSFVKGEVLMFVVNCVFKDLESIVIENV